jgi:hypothetical protein
MMTTPLDEDRLRAVAPSVYAERPWAGVSDRYMFVPTSEVVRLLGAQGYLPVKATSSRTRISGKEDFVKHCLRFRHQDQILARNLTADDLGTLFPEIVVTNSHDTGSAFKVDLGLFRLVCANGMVVPDGVCPSVSVRHSGTAEGVIDAAFSVISSAPAALESAREMNSITLSPAEARVFANAAADLRWPREDGSPTRVSADEILRPRRAEDNAPTLWNALNRVQEKVLGGGVRVRGESQPAHARGRRSVAVASVDGDRRLNKALWTLAEEMRRLKSN